MRRQDAPSLAGVVVLMPSLRKVEGGVDVFVASLYHHQHADELRNIAYTMD